MKTLLLLAVSSLAFAAAADTQEQKIQKRSLVVNDRIEVIERIDVTTEKPLNESAPTDPAVRAILEELEALEQTDQDPATSQD